MHTGKSCFVILVRGSSPTRPAPLDQPRSTWKCKRGRSSPRRRRRRRCRRGAARRPAFLGVPPPRRGAALIPPNARWRRCTRAAALLLIRRLRIVELNRRDRGSQSEVLFEKLRDGLQGLAMAGCLMTSPGPMLGEHSRFPGRLS